MVSDREWQDATEAFALVLGVDPEDIVKIDFPAEPYLAARVHLNDGRSFRVTMEAVLNAKRERFAHRHGDWERRRLQPNPPQPLFRRGDIVQRYDGGRYRILKVDGDQTWAECIIRGSKRKWRRGNKLKGPSMGFIYPPALEGEYRVVSD